MELKEKHSVKFLFSFNNYKKQYELETTKNNLIDIYEK